MSMLAALEKHQDDLKQLREFFECEMSGMKWSTESDIQQAIRILRHQRSLLVRLKEIQQLIDGDDF